jgi:GNAT superfamily N-acetyltransferase
VGTDAAHTVGCEQGRVRLDGGALAPLRNGQRDHYRTRGRPHLGVLVGLTHPIDYQWRGAITDAEMVALVGAHGGHAVAGWWDQVRPYSLGWVTARLRDGGLVGFVNVAWDGGDHAFLIDTKVASEYQRRGIATALVNRAILHVKMAGCEWVHVDFEEHLAPFYFDACGSYDYQNAARDALHFAALSDRFIQNLRRYRFELPVTIALAYGMRAVRCSACTGWPLTGTPEPSASRTV